MDLIHRKLLLLLFLAHLLTQLRLSSSYPDFWSATCVLSNTNSSINATNLNALLPSLSSEAAVEEGFLNGTAGESRDRVFGFVARDAIVARDQVWYPDCFLRVANRDFFSILDFSEQYVSTLDPYKRDRD